MESSRSLHVGSTAGGGNNAAELHRVAVLAIELRDKLAELELQMKLLKPIATEILRTVDNRQGFSGNSSFEPSNRGYGSLDDVFSTTDVRAGAPTGMSYGGGGGTSDMLVGLRWDFDDHSPGSRDLGSGTSMSSETHGADKASANYLWKRMMKRSQKRQNVMGGYPSQGSRNQVPYDEAAFSKDSFEVRSVMAEIGSTESLDKPRDGTPGDLSNSSNVSLPSMETQPPRGDSTNVIPFDLLPFENSEYLMLLRFIRAARLPYILKTSPIYTVLKIWLGKIGIGETYFGFVLLFSTIIMCLHLQACTYWFFGKLGNFTNASIRVVQNKTSSEQYAWGFFQGVGNTFPLIFQPENAMERWVVIIFAFLNAVLYAVVVGNFSSYVVGLNASARLYRQKMDELHDYMSWKKIPRTTKEKVIRYYEIKYRGKFFEEGTLLAEMNESLRTEIAVHNCRELIEKVPFLRRQQNDGRDEQFLGRIARSLSVGYYVAGDFIIRQGEIGTEMYFIVTGKVNILVNNNQVATFSDGAFFGEVALIANIPRTASVVAAQPSIIYRLTRNEFMDILLEFDDMRVRIDRIYQERMAKVRAERALADADKPPDQRVPLPPAPGPARMPPTASAMAENEGDESNEVSEEE
ncbi:hypothetical protein HDU96_006499 [Phlyctochytrium bullatum]|nr:hypothetical protein HDU96_006499 [Phlyctochytrium bullatum]